jgi:TolB protein
MRMAHASVLLSVFGLACGVVAQAGELAGHRFLITSIRTGDTEIFLVDPYWGDATNLTRCPQSQERYPCWSPDGRQIAFTSDRDGTYNLYVMDANGANVRQLTREKPPVVCYAPTWSGGDGRLVFGLHGDKALICAIAPDGTHFRALGAGHDPCISPDGNWIAFTGPVDNGYCVFAMDADGGNVRQVTTHVNIMGSVFPAWSPDGTRIAYTDQVGEVLEIFVCNTDGSNARQLTSLGKMSSPAAWSPDGKRISFRVCDTAFWRDPVTSKAAHEEKRPDFRPVYVMGADGSDPHIVEILRYHCAIDGSRAVWKPR